VKASQSQGRVSLVQEFRPTSAACQGSAGLGTSGVAKRSGSVRFCGLSPRVYPRPMVIKPTMSSPTGKI
jgi:hypothetical protein